MTAYHEVVPSNHLERAAVGRGRAHVVPQRGRGQFQVRARGGRRRSTASASWPRPTAGFFNAIAPQVAICVHPVQAPGHRQHRRARSRHARRRARIPRAPTTGPTTRPWSSPATSTEAARRLGRQVLRRRCRARRAAAARHRRRAAVDRATRVTVRRPRCRCRRSRISWLAPPADERRRARAAASPRPCCGSGESSRLNQTLVYAQQLASQAGFDADLRAGPGLLPRTRSPRAASRSTTVEAAAGRDRCSSRKQADTRPNSTRSRRSCSTQASLPRQTPRRPGLGAGRRGRARRRPRQRQHSELADLQARDRRRRAARAAASTSRRRTASTSNTRRKRSREMSDVRDVDRRPRCWPRSPRHRTAVAACAQPYPAPPAPAAPRPLGDAPPVEQKLPNGLRVVAGRAPGRAARHGASCIVLAGSEADPRALAGLARLTADAAHQGHARAQRDRRSRPPPRRSAARSTAAPAGTSRASSITVAEPQARRGARARRRGGDAADLRAGRARALAQAGARRAEGRATRSPAPSPALRRRTGCCSATAPYGHPAGGTPASLQRIARADLVAAARSALPPRQRRARAGRRHRCRRGAVASQQKHFGALEGPRRRPPPAAGRPREPRRSRRASP